jgi:hydrogenase-4 component B
MGVLSRLEQRMSEPAWMVVGAVALVASSGVPGIFLDRGSRAGERIAVAIMAVGAVLGLAGASMAAFAGMPPSISLPWPVPGGAFSVAVDTISALFVAPVFLVSLLGSIYGLEYWSQSTHPENARKLRLFYGVLAASLALLVIARNTVLFLGAWEVMAVAAFLLITTQDEDPKVRETGLLYLVLTHVGTLSLFAMFALLRGATGRFDFAIAPCVAPSAGVSNAIFVLALAGFGLKAGLMPLHIWLPSAHANAPSHVSALMSGVLIKMGIYGLVRVTSLFPAPPAWWGATLLVLGGASGVLGVAYAIGQHDIKRLLAYHSVENIGIIVMGLGLAVVGRSSHRPELVLLGIAGALFHTWNHGLFKALLFLSTGSLIHATGTRAIDRMGGLARAMPRTALAFLVGAVAICGLPPLNGFVSEYLLYVGFLHTVARSGDDLWLAGAFGAPALALIGALAVACFVKVFGAVFLGAARSPAMRDAHESGRAILGPMGVLVFACALLGFAPRAVAPLFDRAAAVWAPEAAPHLVPLAAVTSLGWIGVSAALLVATTATLAWILRARVRAAPSGAALTWDCGYAVPSARMQYTASSFADTIVAFFGRVLRSASHAPALHGPFPTASTFESHVDDAVLDRLLLPATRSAARGFGWFRWMERGHSQLYIVLILVAIVATFLAKCGVHP